ncbi:MAG: PilC/PilY family type IV pilus protein [Pseudomonadota bacterium]
MMKILKGYLKAKAISHRTGAFMLGLLAALAVMPALAVVAIDNVPLSVPNAVPGNMVLVPSVEWPTVVTQANDPGVGETSANYSTASVTTCPTGYTIVSGVCEISVAATLGCPDTYTLDGTICRKTVLPAKNCPDGTYTLNGAACEKTVPATAACPANYNAPSGGTCQGTIPANAACPTTYTLNGSNCQRTVAANVACPTNYTLNGSTCQRTVAANAACPDATYTLSGGSCTRSGTQPACPTAGSTYFKTTSSGGCYGSSGDSSVNENDRCDSPWTRPTSNGNNLNCTRSTTATPTYSCSSGTPSGSGASMTCLLTSTPTYSCSAGTLSGSNCLLTATPTYSCSIGTLSGTNCTLPVTTATYSCPSGTPIGSGSSMTCAISVAPAYSCPSGTPIGSGSSMTCGLTATSSYFCPSGTARGTGSSMICVTASVAPTTVQNSYSGYFNPNLCYAYQYDAIEANRYFYPVIATGANFSCQGKTQTITVSSGGTRQENLWSGNYLNWVSMQAIDTFRLALTGGYRVNRPADGAPEDVTITNSSGVSMTYTTSERANVTYLEKANSDRWDDSYTKLRRMTAADSNVDDATPYTGNTGFRARIGALRNQMWFAPKVDLVMGSGRSYDKPCALALPIVPDTQPEPGGATIADPTLSATSCTTTLTGTSLNAIPYNPAYHALPNADTTTSVTTTACGVGEAGCTVATSVCPVGYTPNAGVTNCTKDETKLACPTTGSTYFKTASSGGCYANSSDTSVNEDDQCDSTWTRPTSNGANLNCTRTLTATPDPRWQHTTYGRNQIYAVSIRVKVCDNGTTPLDTRDICTKYGSNYKPEGLLQRNAKKIRYSLFSYLTETGVVRNGGAMRARQKLISPVSAEETAGTEKPYPDRTGRIADVDNPEWDLATGMFINNPDSLDATATSTKVGACTTAPDGSGCVIKYSGVINYLNRFGQINTGQPTLKSFDNLAELYYTAMRYLRGLANISTFSNLAKAVSGSDLVATITELAKYQNTDGLPVIENWYKTGVNSAVQLWNGTTPPISVGTDGDPMLYQCQTTVLLGIGDTSTQQEQDTNDITKDSGAPSSTWRAFTEYTDSNAGRGNVAGLAYWGHLNDIRADVPNSDITNTTTGAKRGQTVSTYWVDVVERNDLFAKTTNQYYNATKFGGYSIPIDDWGVDGNATRHDATWFANNQGLWSSATQNVKTVTGLGGTGDFFLPNNMYLANNGQKMINGLNSAFQKISEAVTGSGASLAANSTQLNSGTTTYQALYFSGTWTGNLKAFAVKSNGSINSAQLWSAVDSMPAHTARTIKTTTDGTTAVDFKTAITDATLRAQLGADGTAQDNMINYLRGDSSKEVKNIGGTFRNRATALGDIIDSQPVFVGAPDPNIFYGKTFTGSGTYAAFASANTARSKRVWVAANDGMLHAFNAECAIKTTLDGCTAVASPAPVAGAETFAYLPKAVITSTGAAAIKNLADPQYGTSISVPHQYLNDGELTVADVYYGSAWHSVLVGTTGRGAAKAIYAIDVTSPTAPTLLWERSAGGAAFDGDSSDATKYIGQMVGKPIIAQTANGVWSVLIANGFNSAKNSAALLQFDINDGDLTVHTTDDTKVNNALAVPAVWIDNPTNGISTDAYAGDLLGNVWHFDLSATNSTVIFTAKDSASNAQPITAGMLIGRDPVTSNVWLFFGTGRYLTQADLKDKSEQTWYGIIVQGTNPVSSSTTRSSLTERVIAGETVGSSTALPARGITDPVGGDMAGKSGWYMDLMVGTAAKGERMVTPNQFQGSLLLGTTRIPVSADPCNPSGSGWIMAINPFTGAPPSSSFFDINNSGTIDNSDKITINGVDYVAAGVGFAHAPNNPIFVGKVMLISFDDASTHGYQTAGTVGILRRLTWREMVTQ